MIWAVGYYRGDEPLCVDLVHAESEREALDKVNDKLREVNPNDSAVNAYPFKPVR